MSPTFASIANIGDPTLLPPGGALHERPNPKIAPRPRLRCAVCHPEKAAAMTATWLAHEGDAEVKGADYHTVAMQTRDAETVADSRLIEQAIPELASHPNVRTRQS